MLLVLALLLLLLLLASCRRMRCRVISRTTPWSHWWGWQRT